MIGQLLNERYQIDAELGRGGMVRGVEAIDGDHGAAAPSCAGFVAHAGRFVRHACRGLIDGCGAGVAPKAAAGVWK